MDLMNDPEGLDYEHACQLIDAELMHYESLIRRELGKVHPDAEAVAEYRHIEQHLLAQRESLNWQDHRTANDVINKFEPPSAAYGDN